MLSVANDVSVTIKASIALGRAQPTWSHASYNASTVFCRKQTSTESKNRRLGKKRPQAHLGFGHDQLSQTFGRWKVTKPSGDGALALILLVCLSNSFSVQESQQTHWAQQQVVLILWHSWTCWDGVRTPCNSVPIDLRTVRVWDWKRITYAELK